MWSAGAGSVSQRAHSPTTKAIVIPNEVRDLLFAVIARMAPLARRQCECLQVLSLPAKVDFTPTMNESLCTPFQITNVPEETS